MKIEVTYRNNIRLLHESLKQMVELKPVKLSTITISKIRSYEFSYKYDDDRSEDMVEFMCGRNSYRGAMKELLWDDLISVINSVRMSKRYRPTPTAGNINCYRFLIKTKDQLLIVNLDYSVDICRINPEDIIHGVLLEYINSLVKRDDIRGNGGAIVVPLICPSMICEKYKDMWMPLLFTSLGLMLQTLTLSAHHYGMVSCIHFGVTKYMVLSIDDEQYSTTCIFRVGFPDED